MPPEQLQSILGRAITDPEYRQLLWLDPARAFEGYALLDPEVQALSSLSRERLEALALELQWRLAQAAAEFEQRLQPERRNSCRPNDPPTGSQE